MLSNGLALPHLLLIAVVVLVLFGKGKVSNLMGEVGKGMTAFRRGIRDGEEEASALARPDQAQTAPVGTVPAEAVAKDSRA